MNTGYNHRFPFLPVGLLPCGGLFGGKKNTGKADALQKTRQDILVQNPNDLTVPWAQRIVDGHSAGTIVSKVDIVSIDIGTTTRVRLFVEHDGPETLPRRWFVKLPSLAWRARWMTALPRLLHTEVRFYRELEQSSPLLRLSLAGPVRRLEDLLGTVFAVPLMKRGLRLADSLVPACLHAPAMHYARNRRQAMRLLAEGTQTLVHHDCHPGNLFWHQSQPGFLDWQLLRIGDGIGDVAYFLATALTPETRRLHEADLLSGYVGMLMDNGVAGIDPENQLQKYRAHLVYPFEAMLLTLAIGGMMDMESNLELIRRTAAAVEDHDAFAVMRTRN